MAIQHQTTPGARFGRYAVIGEPYRRAGTLLWRVKCRCECGAEKDVICKNLTAGKTKSCGCFNSQLKRVGRRTHGMSKTGTWRSYWAMVTRCTNPKAEGYARYGGRGIKVCDRWLESFENFLSDMGERPDGMTIERNNNDGDYEPGNCRWATDKEQRLNRADNRRLVHEGQDLTISQWAQRTGIDAGTISVRLQLGWTARDALTVPVQPGRNQFGSGVSVTFQGKTMTWKQWAGEVGISYPTLKKRTEMGWSIERALTQPLETHRKR